MIFFTISSLPAKVLPSPLSLKMEKPIYSLTRDSDGFEFLSKTGSSNLYEEIQIFKDECNIYNIIRRYQLGDQSVLSKCNGQYIDTLGQPKTMQEALNLSIKLKDKFNSLLPEVQSAFGNDFNKFLTTVADGSVVDILSKFTSNKTIEEVPSDES